MDIDELYALPPARFVPERDALAKELRQAGRRDEAAAIAALRKPSVAAHAVNQLARAHQRELHQLFTAGDALSEVQSAVLAGTADGRALGEAAERERAAVSALVEAARELFIADAGQPPSSAVLERVSETLHAAALDEQARAPVDQGRLERELRHVGLGMFDLGEAPAPAPAPPDDEPKAEARRRAKARRQAETAEAEARREAQRTAKALAAAERKRARAADALKLAETALTEARQAAKAAKASHRDAEQRVRRLTP